MKKLFFTLIIFWAIDSSAQMFFSESFDYPNYHVFKEISLEDERWSFFHAENQDFNKNNIIDSWENIKSIELDSLFNSKKSIRFVLSRIEDNLLLIDVMKNGEIDGEVVDYSSFIHHVNRAEIATWDYPYSSSYLPNRRYAFKFSNKVPEDFEFENQHCNNPSFANYDIMGQWHFSHYVDTKTKPPLSLRIVCDTWYLSIIRENNPEEQEDNFIPIAKVEKGKWVDWEFKFRLSHRKRGFIELYKDGELVYSEKRTPNIESKWINNKLATFYFKIGVYKPHWWSRGTNVSTRVVYFDSINVSR